MAKTKTPKINLNEKICAMLAAKDTGKASYAEADRLLQELVPQLTLNQPVDLGNGEAAALVDNFAKGNKVWKPCGVNRYDIKVSRAKATTPQNAKAKAPEPAKDAESASD